MEVEVQLYRFRNGKPSTNLIGIAPDINVGSYEEAVNHPEVREMILQAYGKHFMLVMWGTLRRSKETMFQKVEVEVTKSRAI